MSEPMGTYRDPNWNLPMAFTAVRRASDQTIGNSEVQVIDFLAGATVEDDDDGMFDTTDPDKLTVKSAGVYLITGNIHWESNATGRRELRILVDSSIKARTLQTPHDGAATIMAISTVVRADVGDAIELWVYQSSGGNLLAEAEDHYSPRLTATRIMR